MEHMTQRSFNFSEIFSCDMTRLRNTNLNVFYTMSIHKNHFKKQNYETNSV